MFKAKDIVIHTASTFQYRSQWQVAFIFVAEVVNRAMV